MPIVLLIIVILALVIIISNISVVQQSRAYVVERLGALKGAAAQEELDECKNAIKLLGLKTESVTHFDVDGADHAVILLKKIASTPARFPRRYAKIKQSPL